MTVAIRSFKSIWCRNSGSFGFGVSTAVRPRATTDVRVWLGVPINDAAISPVRTGVPDLRPSVCDPLTVTLAIRLGRQCPGWLVTVLLPVRLQRFSASCAMRLASTIAMTLSSLVRIMPPSQPPPESDRCGWRSPHRSEIEQSADVAISHLGYRLQSFLAAARSFGIRSRETRHQRLPLRQVKRQRQSKLIIRRKIGECPAQHREIAGFPAHPRPEPLPERMLAFGSLQRIPCKDHMRGRGLDHAIDHRQLADPSLARDRAGLVGIALTGACDLPADKGPADPQGIGTGARRSRIPPLDTGMQYPEY